MTMARWITCDEVFDVLTQGPFPTGDAANDAAVELHLTGCHECRQLAEGLRPAVEMLQEAMLDGDESLPAYRGSLPRITMPANVVLECPTEHAATAVSAPVHMLSKPDPKSIWIAHLARVAAACLLILLMLGIVPLAATLRGAPTASEIRSRLMAAPLPAVCRAAFEAVDPTTASEGCCARCHHPSDQTGDAVRSRTPGDAVVLVPDVKGHALVVSEAGGQAAHSTLLAQGSMQLIAKSCLACHD